MKKAKLWRENFEKKLEIRPNLTRSSKISAIFDKNLARSSEISTDLA